MRFRDARRLFEYWQDSPLENEMLAMFAKIYTTWKPQTGRVSAEEDHRKSLEDRWKAGAMNPKQMFEAMGGAISLNAVPGQKLAVAQMPGIGPFPGAH